MAVSSKESFIKKKKQKGIEIILKIISNRIAPSCYRKGKGKGMEGGGGGGAGGRVDEVHV